MKLSFHYFLSFCLSLGLLACSGGVGTSPSGNSAPGATALDERMGAPIAPPSAGAGGAAAGDTISAKADYELAPSIGFLPIIHKRTYFGVGTEKISDRSELLENPSKLRLLKNTIQLKFRMEIAFGRLEDGTPDWVSAIYDQHARLILTRAGKQYYRDFALEGINYEDNSNVTFKDLELEAGDKLTLYIYRKLFQGSDGKVVYFAPAHLNYEAMKPFPVEHPNAYEDFITDGNVTEFGSLTVEMYKKMDKYDIPQFDAIIRDL
jgi:hypothetical protein